MFSAIASAILMIGLFFPQVTYANDEASASPRTVKDVRVSESIERFKKAREQSQNQREQIREEFKERLSEISDERKQKILQNIDEQIVKVNAKWVEHWNNTLARLSGIVAKIDDRSAGSIDTSTAKTAISSAQEAVTAQAGKTYEITIEDEQTLGENVRAVLQEFHGDLREVHALIKTAREEVVKVLRELKEGNEE